MHFFNFYSCSSNLCCLELFFCIFFNNGFEISVKFCIFDTFLMKKKILGHISTFFKL
jgi:hypothetical protein